MKTNTAAAPALALAVLTTLLAAGCSLAGSSGEKSGDQVTPQADPLAVHAEPALLGQLKIGEPGAATVSGSLDVPGRVEVDETRVARVGSPVTGRIMELAVEVGQTVKRGQVLATLHSTELSDAQSSFLKAFSQRQLAQRSLDRAKQLLQADVIGAAELQRREAELAQASADLSSASDQLKVLGMSEQAVAMLEMTRHVNSRSQVAASIDGAVLERKVTIGQIVQPADTVFVVADLSNVWLVADVPEQAAGAIATGKKVTAQIPALPGVVLKGALSFVGATVNAETRTVRVRMDVPNPDRRFKPAMLAAMSLQDRPQRQRVVPAAAVVREANRDHVFVETGPGAFLLREVSLGAEYKDLRVFAGGLRPGEKIVLDGAFHLNNERKKAALHGE